jgi:hypothetical protein
MDGEAALFKRMTQRRLHVPESAFVRRWFMNRITSVFRMHYVAALLLFLSAVQPLLYSQTDSALGFYPLKLGNLWQYKHYSTLNSFPTFRGYEDKWIAADTIVDHHQYWILSIGRYPSLIQSREILRVDSASSIVYHIYQLGNPENAVDSLRSGVGSGHYSTCFSYGDFTIFGVATKAKHFGHQGDGGDGITYAYGFGIVLQGAWWPTSGPVLGYKDSLIYTRIDGKEYGTYLSVGDPTNAIPAPFSLEQNYPNPFNPSTTIRYGLPNRSHVTLSVYNTLGQQVVQLVNGEMEAGFHEVRFNGEGLSSGVYFYRIQAGAYVETKKLILTK